MTKSILDVRKFWEESPLFTGESRSEPGTRAFFDEHRNVIIEDCLAGYLDKRFFRSIKNGNVLDVGCGPGFWVIELAGHAPGKVFATDLTMNGLLLTRKRTVQYGTKAFLFESNAECLPVKNCAFAHVNCQGVIHHTPDTDACVREIARILESGGTASLSVYYQNAFLKMWPFIRWAGRLVSGLGGQLKGRGREGIFNEKDPDEIVRLYDGRSNPIGKSYSRKAFFGMLEKHFFVDEIFYHLFPARTIPFRIPRFIHRFLDMHFGFMICANVRKK